MSFRSRAASKEECNSSLGIVKASIGATLAFPITKSSSVLVQILVVTFPRKNETALKNSCEQSLNT